MAGALRTEAYRGFLVALVELRQRRGLSQADLAGRLGKPPSFVGKYELGERRLDVVEALVVLTALDEEPLAFITQHLRDLPERLG